MSSFAVRMDRTDLDRVPDVSLPETYRFRWYRPGDENDWIEIHRQADGVLCDGEKLYWEQFGQGRETLPQRQVYVLGPGEKVIGTASAWFDPETLADTGRIHWVAILPSHQGQGLAKPLLSCVMNRLHELGHANAYLTTQTHRLPAIKLYLKYGFRPTIRDESDQSAWRHVARELGVDLPECDGGQSSSKQNMS